MSTAVCLLSGGLDSTTLAYLLASQGYELECISIFYGQRHATELTAAERITDELGADWTKVDISNVGNLLSGSALTDPSVEVPHGHYADESMKLTVVPNRNAIMLSVAFGIAAARGAVLVGAAMHAGDHPIYPDCRPGFTEAFNKMERQAFDGMYKPVELYTPFINISKADIVKQGHELGVPYELTWSCYEGKNIHCGECGTCVERKEAFQLAGVPDPTLYLV
jgi:7-cyano-7-deazaguanine synthase